MYFVPRISAGGGTFALESTAQRKAWSSLSHFKKVQIKRISRKALFFIVLSSLFSSRFFAFALLYGKVLYGEKTWDAMHKTPLQLEHRRD